MPFLVQTRCMGHLHHSIEYRDAAPRSRECLGKVLERLRITDKDAARGIDALVRENFPEAVPTPEAVYHGA